MAGQDVHRTNQLRMNDSRDTYRLIYSTYMSGSKGVVTRDSLPEEYGFSYHQMTYPRMERQCQFPKSFRIAWHLHGKRVYWRREIELWMRTREHGIPWQDVEEKLAEVDEILAQSLANQHEELRWKLEQREEERDGESEHTLSANEA